jgi:iron complex transport system ATP-binding protein
MENNVHNTGRGMDASRGMDAARGIDTARDTVRVERDRPDLLELDGLETGYGRGRKRQSLSGPLYSRAGRGELIALMGRNGCGKSTLLRTLAGLQDPLKGRILVYDKPLREYQRRELARVLGFVSTEVIRVQGLRVRSLVAMGRYPHTGWFGSLSGEDEEIIRYALGITSLTDLGERDLDELSDGERQRAMIARTLAQDTRVLILDEPTAFLDITHRHEIVALMGRLVREHGKTVIFSTHDLQLSLRVADRIWLMKGKEIVEGAPEDMVLNGLLEEALLGESDADDFSIDTVTGDMVIRKDFNRAASLEAVGDAAGHWTRRALERMGFGVEDTKRLPLHVLVEEVEGVLIWTVEKSGKRLEANSIYELSLYLRTIE